MAATNKQKPVLCKVNDRGQYIVSNLTRNDFRVIFYHLQPYKDILTMDHNEMMRLALLQEVYYKVAAIAFRHGHSLRFTKAQALAFHETFKYEQYVGHITHDIVCLINRKIV